MTDMNETNVTGDDIESICEVDSFPVLRVAFVSFGTILSLLGTACNGLLLFVFIRRPPERTTLYHAVLALLDLLLCLLYIFVFSFNRFAVTFRIESLYYFVWSTNVFMFTSSRMVQCAIPYVLIASTAERLALVSGRKYMTTSETGRIVVVIIMLAVIVAVRLPGMFAMTVNTGEKCDFFLSKALIGTELVQTLKYRLFDFIVQFLHIFASFVILLILNIVIVKKLRECHQAVRRQSNMIGLVLQLKTSIEDEERREKTKLRSAIRTTVVLISSYLACNSLHFCLYIMEMFNGIVLQAAPFAFSFITNTMAISGYE
uniref:G_PROTEIN_RECEP_F1_2 domain-containing protein n=1 Tax=Steinernema glaseri TaxID=37863 RepID=A0A1I7ZV01_9BILA